MYGHLSFIYQMPVLFHKKYFRWCHKLNCGDLTEFLKLVCYQELVVGKYLFLYMTSFFMEIQEKARLYQYFSKIAPVGRN